MVVFFLFHNKANGIISLKKILYESVLWCYHNKFQTCPTTNHLKFCLFFVGGGVGGFRFDIYLYNKKLSCEFITTFSCHSKWTKRSTLILIPNVNSQGTFDCYWWKPMLYSIIEKHAHLLQCDLTQSMLRHQSTKSRFILFSYY